MASYFERRVPPTDYRLWGYLRISPYETALSVADQFGDSGAPLPLLGDVGSMEKLLVTRPIQEVIAIQASAGSDWLKKVIEDCAYYQVPLRIVPEALAADRPARTSLLYRHFPQNLPAVLLEPRPWNAEALFFKRMIDIAVSALLLRRLAALCPGCSIDQADHPQPAGLLPLACGGQKRAGVHRLQVHHHVRRG